MTVVARRAKSVQAEISPKWDKIPRQTAIFCQRKGPWDRGCNRKRGKPFDPKGEREGRAPSRPAFPGGTSSVSSGLCRRDELRLVRAFPGGTSSVSSGPLPEGRAPSRPGLCRRDELRLVRAFAGGTSSVSSGFRRREPSPPGIEASRRDSVGTRTSPAAAGRTT